MVLAGGDETSDQTDFLHTGELVRGVRLKPDLRQGELYKSLEYPEQLPGDTFYVGTKCSPTGRFHRTSQPELDCILTYT